jgi:hypothetical protein
VLLRLVKLLRLSYLLRPLFEVRWVEVAEVELQGFLMRWARVVVLHVWVGVSSRRLERSS